MSEPVYLDNGLVVTETMTTPSNPRKKPRKVWEVSGAINAYKDALYELGGKMWRGKFSFFEDPTDDLRELGEDERLSFAEQVESKQYWAGVRADRLAERADKHQSVANAAYDRAKQIGDGIPLGQPILVGHHSERHARADVRRIDNAMRTSVNESSYADHLRTKAAAASLNASGEKITVRFMKDRQDEAEAELRGIDRDLEKYASWGEEWVKRKQAYRAEVVERIEYWKQQIEAAGGIQYSKENIKVGDWVKRPWGWHEVKRVNAKSVSYQTDYSWTETLKYHEIQGHKTAAEWQELMTAGRIIKGAVGYTITKPKEETVNA